MVREVAIIGLGWVTSIGCNGSEVLQSLLESRSGIRLVDWFPDFGVASVRGRSLPMAYGLGVVQRGAGPEYGYCLSIG